MIREERISSQSIHFVIVTLVTLSLIVYSYIENDHIICYAIAVYNGFKTSIQPYFACY